MFHSRRAHALGRAVPGLAIASRAWAVHAGPAGAIGAEALSATGPPALAHGRPWPGVPAAGGGAGACAAAPGGWQSREAYFNTSDGLAAGEIAADRDRQRGRYQSQDASTEPQIPDFPHFRPKPLQR